MIINISLVLRIALTCIGITHMVSYRERCKRVCVFLMFALNICGSNTADYFFNHPYKVGGIVDASMLIKTCFILAMFVGVGAFAKGGPIKQIFAIAIMDVVASCLEFLASGMDYVLRKHPMTLYVSDSWFATAIYLILYAILLIVLWKPMGMFARSKIENHILVQIVSSVYAIAGCMSLFNNFYRMDSDSIVTKMSFGVFLAIWFILIIVLLRDKNVAIRNENREMLLQEQMKKEHMALLQDQYRQVRRMRHDIKKHISFLEDYQRKFSDEEDVERLKAYQKELLTLNRKLGIANYCPNQDVNMMFYQLEKCCNEKGIAFDIQLRNLQFSQMSAKQVYDLFWDTVNWWKKELSIGAESRYERLVISGQESYDISVVKIEGVYRKDVADTECCQNVSKVLRF